jgi:hypothetical protein
MELIEEKIGILENGAMVYGSFGQIHNHCDVYFWLDDPRKI